MDYIDYEEVMNEVIDLEKQLKAIEIVTKAHSEPDENDYSEPSTDYNERVSGWMMQVDETPYAEILKAKRPVDSQFLVPSRVPTDTATANGSASVEERTRFRNMEETRKQLTNMKFTQQRANGYKDTRSNGDYVDDLNALNTDQASVQGQGYIRPTDHPDYEGRKARPIMDSGVFAKDVETEDMRDDNAYNAAAQKLKEAQNGADIRELVSELYEQYPELQTLKVQTDRKHPAIKLGEMYAATFNPSRISNRSTKGKKDESGRKFA